MGSFEFPKNIKQIGTIEDGLKIYIEDYVCTYLSQYAEGSGYDERLAFLVGRSMVIDGQSVLFISGCIQSMYCVYEKGIISFSDKSWSYAKEQLKRYFRDLNIVGWMQSQPGYGIHLNSNYENYHINNFIQNDHVLFVMDPIEKVNAFYIWNDTADSIVETKGYFIYYDKNRCMHEYMLDHRIASKVKLKDIPITREDLRRQERLKERNTLQIQRTKPTERIEEQTSKDADERIENDVYYKPIIRERQAARAAKYVSAKQKRVVNMLMSLSAVMLIICFIMGAGLIQNDGRISSLERQLTQLNTAYRDLLLQLTDGRSSSVFAADNEKESQETAKNQGSGVLQDKPPAVPSMTPAVPTVTPTVIPTVSPTVTPTATPTINPTVQPTDTPSPEPIAVYDETGSEPENTPDHNVEVNVEFRLQGTPVPQQNSNYDPTRIPDTYLVQQGDNLSYISQKFYGDRSMVERIMELNGLTDPNKVYFGTILFLPK